MALTGFHVKHGYGVSFSTLVSICQHEFSELLLGKLYNGDNIFNHANMFNSDNPVVVFIQVILSMSWYQPYQS